MKHRMKGCECVQCERKREWSRERNRERYATDADYRKRCIDRQREIRSLERTREQRRRRYRERVDADPDYREGLRASTRERMRRYALDAEWREQTLRRSSERRRKRRREFVARVAAQAEASNLVSKWEKVND